MIMYSHQDVTLPPRNGGLRLFFASQSRTVSRHVAKHAIHVCCLFGCAHAFLGSDVYDQEATFLAVHGTGPIYTEMTGMYCMHLSVVLLP